MIQANQKTVDLPKSYNAATFQLPKEFFHQVTTLNPTKSTIALIETWIALVSLIWVMVYAVPTHLFWPLYVPIIFAIASRYGALLQLIHEASHGLLSHSKKRNLFIARWLCAYPIGVFLDGYIAGHMNHHSGTNTERDPASDTEKYRVVDFHSPEIYRLFLKDILGITALSIFFQYKTGDDRQHAQGSSRLLALSQIAMIQLVLLVFVFHLDVKNYILLWLIPAISPHMFLMRIRGIAEHGLPKQLGITVRNAWEGTFLTRSFITPQKHYKFLPLIWIEQILIGSLNVNYHHEHHLFPTVPFYHLPELHNRIAPSVSQANPDVYARGYFAATLRSLLVTEKTPMVVT